MHKKQFLLFLLLPLVMILAACSAGGTTASASTAGQGQNPTGQAPDMANQPIEQKLAVGTLMLEDSDLAVTAEQAKALLPLWKAIKTLSSDSNTAQEEINSVYTQIQEAMTAEQVQKIKDMSMSMDDTRALMEKYGIEMPQNPGGTQLSESERATRVAERQAQGGTQSRGQGGTGGFPGGGMPPDGGMPGGGMPGAGMPGGAQSGTQFQGTPQPGQAPRGMRGGFNTMFIEALIKLLTERAGA